MMEGTHAPHPTHTLPEEMPQAMPQEMPQEMQRTETTYTVAEVARQGQRLQRAHEAAAKWRLLCLKAEGERDELRAKLTEASNRSGDSTLPRRAPLTPSSANGRTRSVGSARSGSDAEGVGGKPEPRVAPGQARRAPAEGRGPLPPRLACDNDAVVGSPTPTVCSSVGSSSLCGVAERHSEQLHEDAQRAERLKAECTEWREKCDALAAQVAVQSRAVAVAEESAEAAELECAALRRAHRHELGQELDQDHELTLTGNDTLGAPGTPAARSSSETSPPEATKWMLRVQAKQQQIARCLLQRCTWRLTRAIWQAWSQHARACAWQRCTIRRALAARGRRVLGLCFCSWTEGTQRQRLRRRAVAQRLQHRQRSGVAWAFRSWLAEITRVRDRELRAASTLVWDRQETARQAVLGRVAERLAKMSHGKSTRTCFCRWSTFVRDNSASRWRDQRGSYAARRMQRWETAAAFKRWLASMAVAKALAKDNRRATAFWTHHTLSRVLAVMCDWITAMRREASSRVRADWVLRRRSERQLIRALSAWARAAQSWRQSHSSAATTLDSDRESQQQLAADSRNQLAHVQQQKLAQMEQRVHEAEEAAARANRDADAQQQQIRKLQRRLKELTLSNSKQAQEMKRQHAQREISLYR